MTIEEYKKQPFKFDGNCQPVLIEEIWHELPRASRREITKLVKNGIIPNIQHYL